MVQVCTSANGIKALSKIFKIRVDDDECVVTIPRFDLSSVIKITVRVISKVTTCGNNVTHVVEELFGTLSEALYSSVVEVRIRYVKLLGNQTKEIIEDLLPRDVDVAVNDVTLFPHSLGFVSVQLEVTNEWDQLVVTDVPPRFVSRVDSTVSVVEQVAVVVISLCNAGLVPVPDSFYPPSLDGRSPVLRVGAVEVHRCHHLEECRLANGRRCIKSGSFLLHLVRCEHFFDDILWIALLSHEEFQHLIIRHGVHGKVCFVRIVRADVVDVEVSTNSRDLH